MKPLSSLNYLSRHKRKTAALVLLFIISAACVSLFIGLSEGTYITPAYDVNAYLEKFSLVQPDGGMGTLPPDTERIIETCPEVEEAIGQTNIRIKIPNTGGAYFPFRIFGLDPADTPAVLATAGAVLAQGNLPEPASNGVALSEEIALSLGLEIGDSFDQTKDAKLYTNIERPLTLTGILSGPVRLGIMSREFLHSQETVSRFAADGLIVISRPGKERNAADFLSAALRKPGIRIYTGLSRTEDVRRDQRLLLLLGIPIVLILTLGITLVVNAVNRLEFIRRSPEIGTLLAIGKERGQLAGRFARETASTAVPGTILGILLSWIILAVAGMTFYAPHGFSLNPFCFTAIPFAAAIPLSVTAATYSSANAVLKRTDPVSIIERSGSAGTGNEASRTKRHGTKSGIRPLSIGTYRSRHSRRTLLTAGVMTFLIVTAALVIFVFSAGTGTLRPALNCFRRMSAVSPNGGSLDESVIDDIRSNPNVARVIPAYDFSPLKISIPPMFPDHPVQTICVSEDDLSYLVDLYGLRLAEGRLPRKGTNEIVLPWTVARNRNIDVGDVIGDPGKPVYPNASALPVHLTVSGIFSPSAVPDDENWLSFMSLEFIAPFRIGPESLLVVPAEGEKTSVDAWLPARFTGDRTIVFTYGNQAASSGKEMKSMLITFAVLESVIIAVAALVTAGLAYFHLFLRKKELGIFLALGHSLGEVSARIVRYDALVSGLSWVTGMLACLGVQFLLQYGVYEKAGLRIDFFNPVPWLFTLPVPVAALLSSMSAAGKILSSVDPVKVIEG